MTDASNNTEPPKQKKRIREHARDWAGMAAFVTAIAAATTGLTQQSSNDDKQARMSKSVFNATMQQLTLIQYRLAVVEQACGVTIPPGFGGGVDVGAMGMGSPPPVAARRPAAATAPATAHVEIKPSKPDMMPGMADMAPPEQPRKAPKLTFDAIQRVVESGEVYEGE